MSTANFPATSILPDKPLTAGGMSASILSCKRRAVVIVNDRLIIPTGIESLESYRQWAHSDSFPASGWVSYLNGDIWVEPDMEELITHNRVRTAYTVSIVNSLATPPQGSFVSDRMLLTNQPANLSTEPDGLFYLWSTMSEGRLRMVPGAKRGFMELEGSPDMIMEILSDSSQRKDKELLRDLYWKAGITEYWLIDARTDPAQFDILRRGDSGYVATAATDGWLRSEVLGREFRLVRHTDPLGHPQFVVEVR